eukprot:TRINITY_DN3945_c0_g5_i1.p1 TRINITY_DN3945_c0_g5~~TRINITY_DN3945_c0_g5_i1.p1  ORF type:complete len:243 (+),score=43.30 TRINITY_DN3945_c0_g5_i1:25-753(+)
MCIRDSINAEYGNSNHKNNPVIYRRYPHDEHLNNIMNNNHTNGRDSFQVYHGQHHHHQTQNLNQSQNNYNHREQVEKPHEDFGDDDDFVSIRIIGAVLMSDSYVTYVLKVQDTMGNGYLVNRRFSEFEALRTVLSSKYPTIKVGELPKKYLFRFRSLDSQVIEERWIMLETFLEEIQNNSVLFNSFFFQSFLNPTIRTYSQHSPLFSQNFFSSSATCLSLRSFHVQNRLHELATGSKHIIPS